MSSSPPFSVTTIHRERAAGIIAGQLWDTPPSESIRRLRQELRRVYVRVRGRPATELLNEADLADHSRSQQVNILIDALAFQVIRTFGPRYEKQLLSGEWLQLSDGRDDVATSRPR